MRTVPDTTRPVTIVCLASFVKGHDFLREAKRQGARVLLITADKHRDADWPRESIDEVFYMPDLYEREHVIHGVSYLARSERIARIVPLDEFDLEMASTLREHLRVPGMGESTVRYFRDKLAMRIEARDAGVPVPEFTAVHNNDDVREYLETVPPPWVLKPRLSASAIGIQKLSDRDSVWRALETLGDKRSYHLLERFVRGNVYHVDSIIWDSAIEFAYGSGYVSPPFEVYHGGGVFCTRTLPHDSDDARRLEEINRRVVQALGMRRGVLHSEFIRGEDDGRFYFLETAARVGGAHIADMVEAATGINLWREWARVEVAHARGERYQLPEHRAHHAGLLVSLSRQQRPDLSAYTDPEIVWRMDKEHHAGLIVASRDARRVGELLDQYMRRFREDFYASMPARSEALD